MRKRTYLATLTLGAIYMAGANSALADKIKEVEVVNTPLPVVVQNPQDTVGVTNDETSPIPVTMQNGAQMTHMGVPVTEHVALEARAIISGSQFFRYDATTNRTTGSEFVVPEGKAFVLTDIYLTQGGYTPGEIVRFGLTLWGQGINGTRLYGSSVSGVAQSDGRAEGSKSFTSGLVIGEGIKFRLTNLEETVAFGTLAGYLVDAP